MGRHHVCTALAVAMTVVVAGAGTQVTTATATSATSDLALKAKLSLTSMNGACSSGAGRRVRSAHRLGLVRAWSRDGEVRVPGRPRAARMCTKRRHGSRLLEPLRRSGEGRDPLHARRGRVHGQQGIYNETQAYSITGGTGIYAGAAGSGTVERNLGEEGSAGRKGPETWTGTLSVPGLDFDTTRPTFTGATNKTVEQRRAPRRAACASPSPHTTTGTWWSRLPGAPRSGAASGSAGRG